MKNHLSMFLLITAFTFIGCQVENTTPAEPTPLQNPVPEIHDMSPSTKVSHMPGFTLTITGAGVIQGTQIVFNGIVKDTARIGNSTLTCQIQPEEIIYIRNASSEYSTPQEERQQNIPVLLRNPGPGGGDSQALDFLVLRNYTFNPITKMPANASALIYAMMTGKNDNIEMFIGGDPAHVRSIDNGQTWTEPKSVFNLDPSNYSTVHDFTAAADRQGNMICAGAFFYYPGKQDHLLFSHSTDNGATWTAPVILPQLGKWINDPVIGINNEGTIFIVRIELLAKKRGISIISSLDNGTTWTESERITSREFSHMNHPSMTIEKNGIIHVAFEGYISQNHGWAIYYINSLDRGTTWSKHRLISTGKICYDPFITTGPGSEVYIVWHDESNDGTQLKFNGSIDSGKTWSLPVNITTDADMPWRPQMAVDRAGNIQVVWHDNKSEIADGKYYEWFEVSFSRSINGGRTWTLPAPLSDKKHDAWGPRIAVDDYGNLFITWDQPIGVFTTSVR